MTDDQLRAIEARADAATPGPWVADSNIYGKGKLVCCRNGSLPKGDRVAEVLELLAGLDSDSAIANALFIAHARADIPALVAEVRRLREQVDALAELGKDLAKQQREEFHRLDYYEITAQELDRILNGESEGE